MMLFIMGLPVFQIFLFCISIGKDPVGLHLAVVNHEIPFGSKNCTFLPTTLVDIECEESIREKNPLECPEPECIMDRLSCQYLEFLEKRKQKVVR